MVGLNLEYLFIRAAAFKIVGERNCVAAAVALLIISLVLYFTCTFEL